MTEWTEPLWTIGNLGQLESSPGGTIILPEPMPTGAGPSGFFGGTSQLDMRFTFLKDLVQGYTGRVPAFLENSPMLEVAAIPMTFQSNNIAAAQTVTSGANMTLVTAPSQGIAVNLPIIPFTGVLNSLGTATSVTTAPIVLDYGFDWMGLTSGSSLATVTNSTIYQLGMPLCIAGTSASTVFLGNVYSINSATVITLTGNAGLTTAATPVGTGNAWGPSEFASGSPFVASNAPYPIPTAALPYVAFGPGLFLDSRQVISRAISVTASATTASTANFTIAGWDIYWQPMTQTIGPLTPTSGTLSWFTSKTFKAINFVTPTFNDGGHNWSVGTSDVYGFPQKQDLFELADVWWNSTNSTSTTGFTAPDFTTPASSTTGDVRGTVQMGSNGPLATGQAGGASTGTVSSGSLTVTGKRLVMFGTLSTFDQLNANLTAPYWQTGRPQA